MKFFLTNDAVPEEFRQMVEQSPEQVLTLRVAGVDEDNENTTLILEVPDPPAPTKHAWELTYYFETELPEDKVEEFARELMESVRREHLTEGEAFHFSRICP